MSITTPKPERGCQVGVRLQLSVTGPASGRLDGIAWAKAAFLLCIVLGLSACGRTTITRAGFPGFGNFTGSYETRAADAWEGAQSTYNGSIVVTALDRGLVESVLPTGFHLAASTNGTNQHPVIHLVGHQRDPMILHAGAPQPAPDPGYQETMLLIPFVVRGSGTKWHTYVVRMYLDDLAAIGIGNTVYAYAKALAQLNESGTPENLTTRAVLPLYGLTFEGRVVRMGQWRSSADALATIAGWSDVQTIFEMPLVGAYVVSGVVTDTRCSYWEWDYNNAEVAPVASRHRFVRSFRDGMEGWVQRGQLYSAPDGAVAVRGLRWRLALPPLSCRF